ncbi:alpha/beta fold hydrolase [Neorhizobium petrolearium]|uniref:Alpha/beta hydrolase n=1 Tax=Neorhizobium petrolearium TaxID=515361 RepID=A0ABY8M1G1_9HYPH|nr:alpha/beta hydrolase [Neorhizobium petrolearium]MCC2613263.1 alpha/beta hydrolase [Neorhizobium petrolearium]WGI68352.1 alpha/beta hydrolase [Neorhizobium petrolearium]
MKAAERTITTRHGRIRISDTQGAGLPLLFLHGSSSSRKVFERQYDPRLLEKTRILALDLPGHGESDDAADPDIAYTMTGLVETVEDVLGKLGIHRLAVFGWSLGGHLAIELLARNHAVEGILIAGTPPVAPGLIGMLRGFHPSFDLMLASKPNWSERDIDRFESICFGRSATPDIRNGLIRTDGRLRAVFSRSMLRGDGHNQRRAVLDADVPVFLVNGGDDPFIRQSYVAGFEDRARGHYVEVIEGAGHALFRERPEPFNAILERFVDTVLVRRTRQTPRAASSS